MNTRSQLLASKHEPFIYTVRKVLNLRDESASQNVKDKTVDLLEAGTVGTIIQKWTTYKMTINHALSGAPCKTLPQGVRMIITKVHGKDVLLQCLATRISPPSTKSCFA